MLRVEHQWNRRLFFCTRWENFSFPFRRPINTTWFTKGPAGGGMIGRLKSEFFITFFFSFFRTLDFCIFLSNEIRPTVTRYSNLIIFVLALSLRLPLDHDSQTNYNQIRSNFSNMHLDHVNFSRRFTFNFVSKGPACYKKIPLVRALNTHIQLLFLGIQWYYCCFFCRSWLH